MQTVPSIQKYMTHLPKSIGFDQTITQANKFMKKLKVRHLPVLKGGTLVGLISDRDINLILQFKDVDPDKVTVEEAYSPDPYFIAPTTPINEVVSHMAKKKFGCAIVVDSGKLVGIFTEIDAYKAFSELLETRLKH